MQWNWTSVAGAISLSSKDVLKGGGMYFQLLSSIAGTPYTTTVHLAC